jgi:hypothetical protein
VNERLRTPLKSPLTRSNTRFFRNPPRFRFQRFVAACITATALAVLIAGLLPSAAADDFSERDPIFSKLAAPMTSIVDGMPFREGLNRIAEQAEVNLWIDRQVDPTAPIVAAGPVGPTVFAAIQKLADQRSCAVMPVANVLLVGRPEWVDQTAASLLMLELTETEKLADVSWDDLVTPSEAIAQAASEFAAVGGAAVKVDPRLPHDLWPATTWKQIDRRVAVTLVLAQFGRKPQSTTNISTFKSVAASGAGRFTRRYSQGKANAAIRDAMNDADSSSRVRSIKGWIQGTGSIAAHRAAVAAIFDGLAVANAPDPDVDTFTLKKLTTTAENAFIQLARSAQKTCVIEPAAIGFCKKTISIEGEDVTLRTLIKMVADQAGVVAEWQGDKIVISPAK